VSRPDFPRSTLEFQRRFADEDACREYLFASRRPDGVAHASGTLVTDYQVTRRSINPMTGILVSRAEGTTTGEVGY
jgi:hypothetical protein